MIEFRSVRIVENEPGMWVVQITARNIEHAVFSSPALLFPLADELASSTAILMNLPREVVKHG